MRSFRNGPNGFHNIFGPENIALPRFHAISFVCNKKNQENYPLRPRLYFVAQYFNEETFPSGDIKCC